MSDSRQDTYLLDRVGQVLGGRYRISTLLNAGGMGSIWIAEHLALKQKVVVKFHEKGFSGAGGKAAVQRFLRESRTLSTVRHRNVTELYEAGTNEKNEPYLIMEYLEGETLHELTNRVGVLAHGRALRIAAEVADGLSVAHGAGIVHRDIKPENIFLKRDANGVSIVKIIDFGVARTVADDMRITAEGRVMGTPGFLSPEQAHGRRDIDGRVDIYALGVTLYEMLSEELPSEGETAMDHLLFTATQDPIPFSSRRPDLGRPTHDVIMKALARDPEQRYPSAVAFRAALLGLAGVEGDADPVSAGPRAHGGGSGHPDMFFSPASMELDDEDLEPID